MGLIGKMNDIKMSSAAPLSQHPPVYGYFPWMFPYLPRKNRAGVAVRERINLVYCGDASPVQLISEE